MPERQKMDKWLPLEVDVLKAKARFDAFDGEMKRSRFSLAPKPETFLDRLRKHAKIMRKMFAPVKTRSRKYTD